MGCIMRPNFIFVCGDNRALEACAAVAVDWVRDVYVEFAAGFRWVWRAVAGQARAAFVAEFGAQMVLAAAFGAMVSELATGHGNKKPLCAVNNFNVADYEFPVESDGAKSAQAFGSVFDETYFNLADFHRSSSNCQLFLVYPAKSSSITWNMQLTH